METHLEVGGMENNRSTEEVKAALCSVAGVRVAQSEWPSTTVVVRHDQTADPAEFIQAVAETGHQAHRVWDAAAGGPADSQGAHIETGGVGTGAVSPSRLREAPSNRFSGRQHVFDLLELSAHLLTEAHPGTGGHRQITIFRQGLTTMVLFAFEAGGQLASHQTQGLISIHVLDGAISVKASYQSHHLSAGQILTLAPGVPHSVTAAEASRMLLTVQLQKEDAPRDFPYAAAARSIA